MHIIIDDALFKPKPRLPPIDWKLVFESLRSINEIEVPPVVTGTLFAWGALGFYRGCRYQNIIHKINMQKYERLKKGKKPEQFYFMNGVFGACTSFAYLFPFVNLFYLSKELWRLEMYLRGIEVDTESKDYNQLCF